MVELQTLDIGKYDSYVLGSALLMLIIFIVGAAIAIHENPGVTMMCCAIFYCLIMQGWRKKE